jgi:hypothetical protein
MRFTPFRITLAEHHQIEEKLTDILKKHYKKLHFHI